MLRGAEALAKDVHTKSFYEKVEQTLRPHRATLLEAFRQWAPEITLVPKAKPFGEPQVVHVVALATTLIVTDGVDDMQLPEWFLPYLQLVPYLEIYDCLGPCQRACAFLPAAMLREAIRDAQSRWANTNAIALLSGIADDRETIAYVVGELNIGERGAEDMSQKLHHIGAPLLGAIQAIWADDLWKYHAQALLMALHRLRLPESADLYIRALGHKSKPVKALAQTGLADLGPQARAALMAGTTAKKKAIRAFCSDQLELLGPTTADAAENDAKEPSVSGFHGLSADEKSRMIERIDAVRVKEELRPAFFKEMTEAPALWFEAMVEVLAQSVGRDDIQHLIAAALREPAFRDRVPTFWSVYLHFLARHNIHDTYNQWQLMQHIAMLPADLEAGVFERAYLGAAGPFTSKLLPHYFTRIRPASTALMLQALKHRSKPVRAAAVMAAADLTENLEPLIGLLKERKKATRIAISEALCMANKELVSPHREQIEAALNKEKVDEVQGLMQSALTRL